MYKVTIYMVDDSFDSPFGGQPTITYGLNEQGVYEYGESTVGHMFYTLMDLNGKKSSYGFHPAKNGEWRYNGLVNHHGQDNKYYQVALYTTIFLSL